MCSRFVLAPLVVLPRGDSRQLPGRFGDSVGIWRSQEHIGRDERGSAIAPQELAWLWRPYLPRGMVCLLTGNPGIGKTYVALPIAAALTAGRVPATGEPDEPGHVLYLTGETSPGHLLRPRFDRLGGEAQRLNLLRTSLADASDIGTLDDALSQTQASLVVADPFQLRPNTRAIQPVVDGLGRLAKEHDCCVLLVHSMTENPTARTLHRILGAREWSGAVRSGLLALPAREDRVERMLVQVKSNVGPLGPPLRYSIDAEGAFRWTGTSELTASAILAPGAHPEAGALAEAEHFLRGELAEEPKEAWKVLMAAKELGIKLATLKRAKERLGVVSYKLDYIGRWQWRLPEAEPEAPKKCKRKP